MEEILGADGASAIPSTNNIAPAPTLPELIEQRRKRQLGKSLSVTVVPPPRNDFEYGAYQGEQMFAPNPHSPDQLLISTFACDTSVRILGQW